MNKLIACALVGFGLTQVLVACSSDDSSSPEGSGGAGGKGGSASAGTGGKASGGSGGSNAQGGSTSGGKGGTGGSGGSSIAGTGGSSTGGTGTPIGGAGPEAGMGGADVSGAGDTGAAGAPAMTIPATKLWLAEFCLARASETKACTGSPDFVTCFGDYEGFFDGNLICTNDDDASKLLALQTSLDNLSTACPMPDTSQIRCNAVSGAPEFIDQNCRSADSARLTATMACMLTAP